MAKIPWTNQLKIGRGISRDGTTGFGTAIEYEIGAPQSTGQTVASTFEAISSNHTLVDKLQISASASVFASAGGGSAAFDLSRSVEINDYYTYALIRVVVANPAVLVNRARFADDPKKLLVDKGWDEFASSYGWEYVEGMITGGSYYGLIEVHTNSRREQLDVSGKLSGFYGPFDASASASRSLIETLETFSKNVYTFQNGGSGDTTERSLEKMLERARDFPKIILANPVVIFALTADYRNTVPLPDIPAPNSLLRYQQQQTLDDLGNSYLEYRAYRANLQFVLHHLPEFDEFRDLPAEQLAKKHDLFSGELAKVSKELDAIVARATKCGNDMTQCPTYSQSITPVALPTIEGDLMSIKELEIQIADLNKRLTEVVNLASAAMGQANNGVTQGNAGINQANAAMQQANTALQQANAAMTQANAAYNMANHQHLNRGLAESLTMPSLTRKEMILPVASATSPHDNEANRG